VFTGSAPSGQREVIEDHRRVDVGRRDAGDAEQVRRQRPRPTRALAEERGLGEEPSEIGVDRPVALPVREHLDDRRAQVGRAVAAGHEHRDGTVVFE
jgi:hypothetical protein